MRILFSAVSRSAAAILVAGVLLTSCKKSSIDATNPEVAALMAFNLASNESAAGFAITGNNLTRGPLPFNSYTGAYLRIFPGNRSVEAFDYVSGASLATASFDFVAGNYYSAFLLSTDTSYHQLITHDNFDSLQTNDQAFVRYINAIPAASSPAVTIASGGVNTVNDNASFMSVSEFKAINAGDVAVSVTNSGDINANRTISLETKKVYTILLTGKPGGTEASAVQIKFIVNGIVDAPAEGSAVSQSRVAN